MVKNDEKSSDSNSSQGDEEEEEEDPELLFSKMADYQFEIDRHRVIVAMIISDFFLFMLKHFK